MEYEFKWLPGTMVPADLAAELAELYSDQYGLWSQQSPRNPGGRIRLSPTRIQKLLLPKAAKLAYALFEGRVIGYAIAIQEKVPDYGVISWGDPTRCSCRSPAEERGKRLLFAIWKFTDHYAWGLLTANPYAIRALEKATRRRCQPSRITRNYRKLRTFASVNVEYVEESTAVEVNRNVARINTAFPIDHSTLSAMLASVTTDSVPWLMGPLNEGWDGSHLRSAISRCSVLHLKKLKTCSNLAIKSRKSPIHGCCSTRSTDGLNSERWRRNSLRPCPAYRRTPPLFWISVAERGVTQSS